MLESAVYAKFAANNTVEVVVTEEMDRAIRDKNRLIATYPDEDAYGEKVEYLVKFPGLTLDQLRALSNSRAVNYMSPAKRIPYTAIVDPHTLDEMEGLTGVPSVKDLIARIRRHAKALVAKHGKGIPRKTWNDVTAAGIQIDRLLGRNKVLEAVGTYDTIARETARLPASIRNRVAAMFDTILEDAGKRLKQIEREAAADPGKKRKLGREAAKLARALQDTPLEESAKALVKKLKT